MVAERHAACAAMVMMYQIASATASMTLSFAILCMLDMDAT